MKYIKKAVLVMSFLLVVSGGATAAVLMDRVVAVVNQEVITWSELYHNMDQDASPQIRALKEEEKARAFRSSEAAYLESLINARLQLQEARSLGIGASAEEINETIENIKKKYNMSEEQFRDSLKKEDMDLNAYRSKLKDQIIISKIVNQQVRGKLVITDEDVQSFLAGNKDFGSGAGGYRISQIFFKKPARTEDRKAVEERAEAVMVRLRAGEGFPELAKAYSEEPMGGSGGSLGLVRKEQLMKEFTEVLAGLKQGEVSRPFWTERGLHIIRLDEGVEPKDPAGIKEEAQKEVTTRAFADRYNKWIKQLREKSFIEIRL